MKTLSLIALTLCVLLSGCASYKLGSSDLPFKKLYVEPARNDSYAPQAQALLTEQTMQALMRDTRIKLTDKENADAILSIMIAQYERRLSATQSTDTARARSYDLHMVAHVSLTDANGEAYFKNRTIESSQIAYSDSGLQPAEYQSMPALTRKLSEQIRTEVLSTW